MGAARRVSLAGRLPPAGAVHDRATIAALSRHPTETRRPSAAPKPMSADRPSQIPDKPRLVRRAPRQPDAEPALKDPLASRATQLLRTLMEYVGLARPKHLPPVVDGDGLAVFLDTRASFIAQTSLYGYLRTRAGMRYPELFDDDPFVASINIAKWHCWLACLGDIAEYAGGLLARDGGAPAEQAGVLVVQLVDGILERTGKPADAGDEFLGHAAEIRARLAACNWAAVEDGEATFHASPTAVIRWAPIIEELKELDESIVRNSVRFRWQEVRRDLRKCLDAPAVMRAAAPG
jgi:hypothetical protein